MSAVRVSVFGSASAREGDPAFQQGLELGRLLGRAGCTVATGGYDGTMGAVSRGAHEAGAHVVGVTLAPWSRFDLRANPWVREEIAADSLIARLARLLEADAFVALPGGVGTLGEVALAWQLLQAWEIPPAPLVLLGEPWRALAAAFSAHVLLRPGDRDLLLLADTPAEAVALIQGFDPELAAAERRRILADLRRG